MSGAGAGGGGGGGAHGFHGDDPAGADDCSFHPFDDVDSFLFHQFQQPRSPCAGARAAGGGDGGMISSYSSITDYLQGFLGPTGLRDDAVKQEEMAVQAASGHADGRSGAPPVTPNCEVGGDEQLRPGRCKKDRPPEEEEEDGETDHDEDQGSAADRKDCKKRSKEKEKEKKRGESERKKAREREPRVAFMTKSEVDHLEDGYRWRKYGQKAVKNSTYPRSYYRCTAARCGVKKRVERSQQDPSTVITTYQGQHTHPRPVAAGGFYSAPTLHHQLGFMAAAGGRSRIDYARGSLPPPMHHQLLLQDLTAAYDGGVLDLVPSAATGSGNEQQQHNR